MRQMRLNALWVIMVSYSERTILLRVCVDVHGTVSFMCLSVCLSVSLRQSVTVSVSVSTSASDNLSICLL